MQFFNTLLGGEGALAEGLDEVALEQRSAPLFGDGVIAVERARKSARDRLIHKHLMTQFLPHNALSP